MANGGSNKLMDATAELGRNPVSKHQIPPEYGDEQADVDGTAESVSRAQIFRCERGQGKKTFSLFKAARRPSGLVGKLHIC